MLSMSEPVTHTIVMHIMQAENVLQMIINEVIVQYNSRAVQYSTEIHTACLLSVCMHLDVSLTKMFL